MYAVKGIFDGQRVMSIDPIPVQDKCDVVITFLEYSIVPQKEIRSIKPENFSVSERMSALESLVGIVHSKTPMLAEKYAKEERLAKQ
ncbi:hypothetical protein R83H12_01013 [Fibrobacteria bacterium R8-3-H12]